MGGGICPFTTSFICKEFLLSQWFSQMLGSSYLRAVFTPQSRYYRLCEFHKSPQNIRPFFFPRYPEFLILEFFMEAGQGGMRDNSFLSLVPGLLPASSFISTVPEMQPWVEHEFSLPPNQLRKAANGCWWHLLSWTVFYCFYSITSNWKVSQIFRKQLSDIYRGENESSQRCFSKWCCPASLICHYSQCVKHQDGCF